VLQQLNHNPPPPPAPGKGLWYLLNWYLVGRQSPSGCFGKEIKLVPLPGTERRFLGFSGRGLLSILTELSETQHINWQNVTTEWLALVLHVRKVSDSNHETEISYHDRNFVLFIIAWRQTPGK
jgi:hypothetical protein